MSKVSLYDLEYVIFDFETTGLYANQNDDILEIGAIKMKGDQPTGDIFSTLVNIQRKIPKAATAVNGITNQDIKDQPTIEEVFPKFIHFIGNKVLLAHNAEFDLSFIERYLKRFPRVSLNNPCLDTLQLSRMLYPYEKKHNLDAIAARFEIRQQLDTRHRSVGDCLLTAKIFGEFLKTLKRRRAATLAHVKACLFTAPKIQQPQAQALSFF